MYYYYYYYFYFGGRKWTWRGGGGGEGLIDMSSGYKVMFPLKILKTKFPSLLIRFIMTMINTRLASWIFRYVYLMFLIQNYCWSRSPAQPPPPPPTFSTAPCLYFNNHYTWLLVSLLLFCLCLGCCYFSFQPVLHDWYNKGCGVCYPVC